MVLQRQEVQRRLPIQRNTQGRAAANASFGVDDPCVDPIFRRVGVARAGTVDERDRSDAVGVGALQIEPAGSRRNNRGDGAPALAAAASTPATAPAPTDRAAPAARLVPAFTQVVVPLFSGTHPDGQQTSALALWIIPNTNATIRRRMDFIFPSRLPR